MKKLFACFLLVAAFGIAQAQELVWNTNLDKAIEISIKTKKPVMLFFTGSDWCYWCKRLQSEVFKQPEFAAWANKNVVLVEVDFPRTTTLAPELQSQNNQLKQFFGIQGFPTIWLVNVSKNDGKVGFEKLGSTGYLEGGTSVWLNAVNQMLKK